MSREHSPGPFKVGITGKTERRILDAGNERIAVVDWNEGKGDVDAVLLASAPALLKALQDICYTINSRGQLDEGGYDYNTETGFAYRKGISLINKVTGEQ